MASLRSLFAPILLYSVSAEYEYEQVILGDRVTFFTTGICAKGEEARLDYRVDQHNTRQVAVLRKGVWLPSDHYKDRVIRLNSCVDFNYTVYTDTGLYELTCGAREDNIQLDVVLAFEESVTERKTAKLKCHYMGKSVESIQWERNGKCVFEMNLSSGNISYGTGFKERVSVSPDDCKQGDFSLTLREAQLEDQGDYFCYVQSNGQKERGNPAAVRLTTNPKETSHTCPPPNTTELGTRTIVGLTAAFVIVAGLFTGLGWILKSRCSNDSSGPRGGGDSDVERPVNSESARPAQVSGGSSGCPPVDSSHEQSTV